MSDEDEDQRAFLALATALPPVQAGSEARARLFAAIDKERYLPFLGDLASKFDLAEDAMRALLLRIDDPVAWVRGAPPIQGHMNFRPGPRHAPLRGGFARMTGGMRLPHHIHTDRELTLVLEGVLVDGEGQSYGPGACIDMPSGSSHSLSIPDDEQAVVALLHGRIEML
jgi:hypothetical protein